MNSKTKNSKSQTKAIKHQFTAKYLKDAQYDSKLFKVVEGLSPKMDRFVKTWDNENFIYLKNKYLDANKDDLERLKYYKIKIWVESFTNDEGKQITYISKIKYIPTHFTEKVEANESSDDEWE